MSELVTIQKYTDLANAELAKSQLEAEGIYCFLANANFIGANALYSIAVGGVELQVLQKDSKKALEILSLEGNDLATFIDSENQLSPDVCPFCGSENLKFEDKAKRSGAWSLLFNFPFLFMRKKIYCQDCNKNIS